MHSLKIRNLVFGQGIPKICVPIVGTTAEEIMKQAKTCLSLPLDVVEWRADWFEDVFHTPAVLSVLKELRSVLEDRVLLFTFRTAGEGGEKAMDLDAYGALNRAVAASGDVDLVDVEAFSEEPFVAALIEDIHKCGVKVIASNHDFGKTPDKDDLIHRMRRMQDLGGDLPKLAVMPKSRQDVLTLLSATEEMNRLYADRPVITMSMAGSGLISRLCGEVFGSAMTFGAAAKASAPGQINIEDLNMVLQLLHKSLD